MSKEMRKPHFFKIMLGDFEKRLRIPPYFVKNFFKESSKDKVHIHDANGGAWDVGLERLANGTFLARGWSKFVKDHELKQHEFVVFRYEGNMHFSMIMAFDTTACEKDDMVIAEPFPGSRIPKKKGTKTETMKLPDVCCHCKQRVNETKPSKTKEMHGFEGGSGGKGFLPRSKRIKMDNVSKIQEARRKKGIWSSRRAPRTGGSSHAEKAADLFRSKFPFFISHIWPSDISHGRKTLPSTFARQHLPRSIINVILYELNEEGWVVVYSPGPERSQFVEGWSAFAQGSSLQVGDYCAFELVAPDEFRVTIFRNIKALAMN